MILMEWFDLQDFDSTNIFCNQRNIMHFRTVEPNIREHRGTKTTHSASKSCWAHQLQCTWTGFPSKGWRQGEISCSCFLTRNKLLRDLQCCSNPRTSANKLSDKQFLRLNFSLECPCSLDDWSNILILWHDDNALGTPKRMHTQDTDKIWLIHKQDTAQTQNCLLAIIGICCNRTVREPNTMSRDQCCTKEG